MKCFVFLSLLVVVLAEEKQPAQPINEYFSNAQKTISDLAMDWQKNLNLPDQTAVFDAFTTNTNTFVTNLQGYFSNISEEVKNKSPEFQKLWSDTQTKLTKVIEDINAKVPNAKESTELLQKQFTEGVQTVIKETNNALESVKNNSGDIKENLANFTKKIVDFTVETTQNLNEQLKKAAEKKN